MCRNGIHLNTNGWYVKFIKFLYKGNVDITKYKSLCPIFWIYKQCCPIVKWNNNK